MLQLVLGRSGSGKTEYVMRSVRELVEAGEKNILVITPEQFSFAAERRLLTDLGEKNINEVELTSFSRLAINIASLYGGPSLPVLSGGSKAVVMKRAIEAVQDKLQLFNRNITSASFVNSVIRIYDEMKSCRVSVEDILAVAKDSERETLRRKLSDIALFIDAYDAEIKDRYYDSAEALTRLYHKLLELDYFQDRTVFIDGFSGFAAQEYKVLEVILAQSKKTYITFCSDSYNNRDTYDLFSYVNSNINILKNVTATAGVPFLTPIILKENHRSGDTELGLVEKYVFSAFVKPYNDVPQNVSLYCAGTVEDECDYTARRISQLLRDGYRAGDITVICRNLDLYERELSFAFSKYNVSYFDDERQAINNQPVVMLVRFLLRTVIYSYRSDDIFSLLKTGLTGMTADDISELENYVYVWGINGSAWKREFTRSTKGFTESISDSDRELLAHINQSREYIIRIINKFAARCKSADVREICTAIFYALRDMSAGDRLRILATHLDMNGKSALAREQGRVWDLLMDILDSLAAVSDDRIISLREFYKLFNLMITNEDLGRLPVGMDNVQLGSADRIRCDNPKVVFVLGANEGEFPQSILSSGLLSEADRMTLSQRDFKLYSYGPTLNAQERYFAYMALSAPTEKLFVSYRGGNEKSGESEIVRGLRSVFPLMEELSRSEGVSFEQLESDSNAFELFAAHYGADNEIVRALNAYFEEKPEYASRLSAVKHLVANEEIQITDPKLATSLFRYHMYLSASRIEDYFNCAFRYFCKFGLNARPRTKAQMDPMQTGTVIHYVLEQIVKEKGSAGLRALSKSEIASLVNTYLSEYLNTKMGDTSTFTPRFRYQFMRLSKMLISVVERLKAEFEHSDFEPAAFELTIGDGSEGENVASKKIILPDGGSIEIKGAIDRVDMYTENGVRYVRVVDYKSGTKHFKLSDIINGLNLQMFIYLFTLSSSQSDYSGIESGVLYMHSGRRMFTLDRRADEQTLKKETDSLYRMKGIVLNDEEHEIAKHMEHELSGRFVPVKLDKNNQCYGSIASLADLGRIAQKIDELIAEMGMRLHSGDISQHPINGTHHDKTCEFCDYRDVCRNRTEVMVRDMTEGDDGDVLKMLKEEYDSEVDN